MAGIRKEDKVSIPENQQVVVAVGMHPPLFSSIISQCKLFSNLFVIDSLLDVANQKEISFTQTTNPISLSEQIENVEQHQGTDQTANKEMVLCLTPKNYDRRKALHFSSKRFPGTLHTNF